MHKAGVFQFVSKEITQRLLFSIFDQFGRRLRMLTPVRLDALLAVCEDRAAVRDSLKEVDTENLREFVTVAASLMAERRPDVLSLMIRALAQGCVTGNCDEALQSAAAILPHREPAAATVQQPDPIHKRTSFESQPSLLSVSAVSAWRYT